MAPLCLFWPGEKADRGKKDIALCIRLVPWSECHERLFPHTQVYHTWKCMRNALMNIIRGICMSPTHRGLPRFAAHARQQPSSHRSRHILRLALNTFFLSLLLFTSMLSGWGFSRSYASAASAGNPNPHLSPPAWLKPQQHHVSEPYHQAKLDPHYQFVASPRPLKVPMSPATLTLSPQAQQFVSNDGRLEVDMPAGAVAMPPPCCRAPRPPGGGRMGPLRPPGCCWRPVIQRAWCGVSPAPSPLIPGAPLPSPPVRLPLVPRLPRPPGTLRRTSR